MALIQTVHLSMANFKSAPVVPAVQNDTDRQIKMVIDDFDLTAGLTGKITFVRSDGTHYEASATLDTATNSFTADIDQALTQPGRTMVQLKVIDTLTVSTFSFVIFVEQDTSGTVTPQEGIDLVTAVSAAEDAADRAESAASTFETDTTLSVSGKAADAKATGEVKTALKNYIEFQGSKNLLKVTMVTGEGGGITFTNNGDGTITINNTSTSTVYRNIGTVDLKANQTYILSGSVANVAIQLNNSNNTETFATSGSGNEASYTPETDMTCNLRFRIASGKSFSNAVCYPMVRFSILDSVFDSYNLTNKELSTKIIADESQLSAVLSDVSLLKDTAVYPFTLDSTLYRPGHPEQIVYSRILNGIRSLIIIAPDNADYYVSTLYAYSSDRHESVIEIKNTNGRTGVYSTVRSSNSDRPTETVTINDNNGVPMAVALIDWSKINKASGVGLTTVSTRIAEECILRTDSPIRFLPIEDYYVTNFKQRIYFDEICSGAKDGYFVVTASGATYHEITYTDRYVEFNVSSTKNFTITITYMREGVALDSITLTIHCNVSAISSKKYMFIGDSYTADGNMQKWFYDQNSGNVTLYGTLGTAPYLHEGRSGWSVNDYFSASKGGVTNPFYNPTSQTFDFAYYMTNNPSFADVDVVNILLGRNDGFSLSVIPYIQDIVDSIYDYNSNIKIYVMVGSNVAIDNSGAGRYLQNNENMNLACFRYNSVVSYDNATIIWQNCNLDDVYDFEREEVDATPLNPAKVLLYTDNVHPSQYGYKSFGVVFNGYMHNLLNA